MTRNNFYPQYMRDRDVLQVQSDAHTTAFATYLTQMDLQLRASRNGARDIAGLVIGSVDAKKIKAGNTTIFMVDGVLLTKSTFEVDFSTSVGTTVPISSFTKYLICLAADGTPSVTEGNNAASAILALLPAVPADEAPIGYLQVATSGAGTFVPDTDDLSDAAVTDTYVNLIWPDTGTDALTALSSSGLTAIGAMPPI